MTGPETLMLGPNGWVPNNLDLPVLLYRGVVAPGAPQSIEGTLAANSWEPGWRDGVYDYDHYHSTAHEALACVTGSARLVLGGPGGTDVSITAGDLLVLPAGTGHRRIAASTDFLLVGAYPEDQVWDICRGQADAETMARIATVPRPSADRVEGSAGPLMRLWSKG